MSFPGLGLTQARFRELTLGATPGDLPTEYASIIHRAGHFWQRFASGIEQGLGGTWYTPWGDIPATISNINSFTSRNLGLVGPPIDMAYGAGWYGVIPTAGSSQFLISRDTFTWQLTPYSGMPTLRGVAWGLGLWVIIGNTQYQFSRDNGVTWSAAINLPGSPGGTSNRLYFINNVFFVLSNNGYLATSTDGINWNQQTTGVTTTLTSVTWNGSVFCAVGGTASTTTTILTSTNLTTWTQRTAGGTTNIRLNGVSAFPSGTLCAVGDSGRIITSSDNGVTWTNQTSSTTNQFLNVVFLGGFMHALEGAASMRSSPTGLSWSQTVLSVNPTIGGWMRLVGKHLVYWDGITNSVAHFSRVNPGVCFENRELGFGMTAPEEISAIFQATPIAQFTQTGIILRGQNNEVRMTTINTASSGRIGEIIRASTTNTNVPAAGTWGDGPSITLTAGIWQITLSGGYFRNGATIAANSLVTHGISTTTGASSTGLLNGISQTGLVISDVNANWAYLPPITLTVRCNGTNIVRLDDNFTYAAGLILYFKMNFAGFSVATPQLAGKIVAVRTA